MEHRALRRIGGDGHALPILPSRQDAAQHAGGVSAYAPIKNVRGSGTIRFANALDRVKLSGSPVVLLVDDEPLVRMLASEILTDCGAVVLEAGNADEALRILKQRDDIVLVFSDVNMPGTMDGLALLQRVHELKPMVELILTSGRGEYALTKLPDDGTFLPKPYKAFKLGGMVTEKLEGRPVEP